MHLVTVKKSLINIRLLVGVLQCLFCGLTLHNCMLNLFIIDILMEPIIDEGLFYVF